MGVVAGDWKKQNLSNCKASAGVSETRLQTHEFLVTVAEHLVMVRPHAATSLLRVYIDRKAGKVK